MSEFLFYASAISQMMVTANLYSYSASPSYLDPGTGSLIIQMAIGMVAGCLVVAKVFWKRIGGFFKGLLSRSLQRDRTED